MAASEVGIAAEQPDDVEANDLARVPERRGEPATGARREAVELGRDPLGRLELGREGLDEPVESPLVVAGEPAERRDRGNANLALVAAEPALEQRPLSVSSSSSVRDVVGGAGRHDPPSDGLALAIGGRRGARADGRGDGGREQQPAAARDRADQAQGSPQSPSLGIGTPDEGALTLPGGGL